MTKLTINWIIKRANLSGGVKSNRLIADAMVRRGHRVNIVHSTVTPPWPPPWRPRVFSHRARDWWKNRGKQRHHLEKSLANVIAIDHSPIRADDVPDADVTIATWWETAEWVRDWPASKGRKAYFIRHYEVHGGDPDRVRATYRLPYKKLVIARWLQRLMAEEFGDADALLVPNGVDRAQFNFAPRGKQPVPTVGFLTGVVAWKGVDMAFDALRRVQRELPETRVVCFGAERVKDVSAAPANLTFHHRPPQQTIPEIYRGVDVWLVPSTLEGFGMPGLEAAACGCPIVATRSGGPEDYVVDGRNGFLVPVGDGAAAAEALLRVLRLDDAAWREMSRASHELSRGFDWDHSAETLERGLYEELGGALRRDGQVMGVGA